jgi:hypothetical protein
MLAIMTQQQLMMMVLVISVHAQARVQKEHRRPVIP